jgi:DNA-binding response OmpR family regulator
MPGQKILIADDDADILEILSLLLAEQGYEIKTLTNGEEVFESINEFQPDLIVMDVMLGAMDGRLICKDVKENPPTNRLPVILISGTHDITESLHLPGSPDDFIGKPFKINHLIEKIQKQLVGSIQ